MLKHYPVHNCGHFSNLAVTCILDNKNTLISDDVLYHKRDDCMVCTYYLHGILELK